MKQIGISGMNLVLYTANELGPQGKLKLSDRRAQQLVQVKGVEVGWRLRVAQHEGPICYATVRQVSATEVVLQLEPEQKTPLGYQDESSQTLPLRLILALPRPQALKRVLQTIAELGVEELVLVGSEKVQKSYFQSTVLQEDNLREHLQLGLEQAVSTHFPKVEVIRKLHSCKRRFAEYAGVRLLADHRSEKNLETVCEEQRLGQGSADVSLAVGPEGGWSESERAWFAELGFIEVASSKRVLKVDTAVTVLVAQLSLLQRVGVGLKSTNEKTP